MDTFVFQPIGIISTPFWGSTGTLIRPRAADP
jgi:hypothetical protein